MGDGYFGNPVYLMNITIGLRRPLSSLKIREFLEHISSIGENKCNLTK
jgi:hypothetical protein